MIKLFCSLLNDNSGRSPRHYRFTSDVLPTATSPMTITLEIRRVRLLLSQVRLIKPPKSLSLYGVVSDEKGGGQSVICRRENQRCISFVLSFERSLIRFPTRLSSWASSFIIL